MEENLDFVEKTSGKKIAAIIFFVIGIILILGCFIYYLFFKDMNPQSYLTDLSSKLTGHIDTYIDSLSSMDLSKEGQDFKQDGKITFKTDDEDLAFFNDYSADYQIISSLSKKEMEWNLKFKEKEEDILPLTLAFKDDSLYFKSLDLYPKAIRLIKLDEDIFSILGENSKVNYMFSDIETILKAYIKNYLEALKLADLKTENVSITEVKYTYNITKENLSKIKDKYTELCKNDQDLKKIFQDQETYNMPLEEGKIEVVVNRIFKDINKLNLQFSDYNLELRKVSKNNYKFEEKIGKETSNGKLEILDNKITYQEYNGEELVTTLEIIQENKGLTLKISDSDFHFSFSVKNPEKEDVRISVIFEDLKDDIKIDLDEDMQKVNDQYQINLLANLEVLDKKINITIKSGTTYGENLLEDTDYSDAVDIENLSEEDENLIAENFVLKFLDSTLLESLFTNDETL